MCSHFFLLLSVLIAKFYLYASATECIVFFFVENSRHEYTSVIEGLVTVPPRIFTEVLLI